MFKKMVAGWLRAAPQVGSTRGSSEFVNTLNCSHAVQNATSSKISAIIALGLGSLAALPAFGAGLNDTGVTLCADGTAMELPCTAATVLPGQDAFYGRDTLTADEKEDMVGASGINLRTKKINGLGFNGFDFTKISNNGGELPPDTKQLGSGSNDWACTRDNVTGLVWEVKTESGLRNQNHTYSWFKTGVTYDNTGTSYKPKATDSLGVASGSFASKGVCETAGRCDTEKFVQDVNATTPKLCGFGDWRMPTVHELQGILDLGRMRPAIDLDYFPNTPDVTTWWSGTPSPWVNAWFVSFSAGGAYLDAFSNGKPVRLVRGVQ